MARILVAPLAADDQVDIFDYLVREAGLRTAERYQDLFTALFRRLAAHPQIGAPRPELGPGTRLGIVHPYVTIYRYDAARDLVMVLRVLHGRRRITSQMLS